jgi:hypothetical protein
MEERNGSQREQELVEVYIEFVNLQSFQIVAPANHLIIISDSTCLRKFEDLHSSPIIHC